MGDRTADTIHAATHRSDRAPARGARTDVLRDATPFALSRQIGNRSMARLLGGARIQPKLAGPSRIPIQRSCAACASAGTKCAACNQDDRARIAVQPKLTIGAPNDHYEQEADRVAEFVSRTSAGTPAVTTMPPQISRYVQREPAGADSFGAEESTLETGLLASTGSGQPLSPKVRESMEQRFGIGFDAVRIHTGSSAHQLAHGIDALAFTHGHNVYFSSGTYAPGTPSGDRLLAHELTHVVQQSGGTTAPIQRARISGARFHAGTEDRFLAANDQRKNLIVEAPLPGATRDAPFDFVKVGFPDLYTSSVKNTAIGVRGDWELPPGIDPKKVNPSDEPNKQRKYVPLKDRERKAKLASGTVKYSPKPRDDGRFVGEFPARISVGDIKPIWTTKGIAHFDKPAEGVQQLANYQKGLKEFVRLAHQDKKVTRGTIETSPLSDLTIPPELDYRNFDRENAAPSPNPIRSGDVTGKVRFWMYQPPGTGIYYYFHLSDPNPSQQARATLEDAFRALVPVRRGLATPDAGINGRTELAQPKRRPGAPQRAARPRSAGEPHVDRTKTAASGSIQRKSSPRVKKDWGALGEAWEQQRADWDRKFAKPFLAGKQGKALEQRVAVNNIIGLTDKGGPGSLADTAKHLDSLKLWSGVTGKALGKIRFLLGTTFDKVSDAFEWVKGKVSDFWARLSKTDAPGFGGGWEAKLVKLLIKAVKYGFRTLVSVFFELCANCVEGIIRKVIARFTEDISEQLQKEVEELKAQFEKYADLFKTEFEKRIGSWEQFRKDLATVQQWADILTTMERLIRLGMQAVACLSPPGLGCLWGLVAQVALDSALSLVVGTDWFQEHVINHPSVRDIIKQYAGPTIRSLIADTLHALGLDKYAKDVEPCSKVEKFEPPKVPPVDPISRSQFLARREEWERVNRPQMIKDLQSKFETKPGQAPSEKQLEELVAAIKRSGKSAQQLKQMFDNIPETADGKLNLGDAKQSLAGKGDKASGKPGPFASIKLAELRKDLDGSDWTKVPKEGGVVLDVSRTIPRLLVRTPSGVRFAALVSTRMETKGGKQSYVIADCSPVMLLSDTAGKTLGEQTETFTTYSEQDGKRTPTHTFIQGSAGEIIDPTGNMFRGVVIDK
jgi:hypothetical protein